MTEKVEHNPNSHGYDKTDVNITKILGYTFTILVVLVAIVIFLYEVFTYSKEQAIYEMVLSPESKAMRELRASEDQVLNSYKVLDAAKGIYQIPIERAIQIISNEAYQDRLEEEN
jgi:hypothetical protein